MGEWWEKYRGRERFRIAWREFTEMPRTKYYVLQVGEHPHVRMVTWDFDDAFWATHSSVVLTAEEIHMEPAAAPILSAWEAGDRTNYALSMYALDVEATAWVILTEAERALSGNPDLE
jgi:hypothetical protein